MARLSAGVLMRRDYSGSPVSGKALPPAAQSATMALLRTLMVKLSSRVEIVQAALAAVRYEDLIDDSRGTVEGLCRFTGIEFVAALEIRA